MSRDRLLAHLRCRPVSMKMGLVKLGEKAALLLFLCYLRITSPGNGADAGEWFGVLRAVGETDDRLPSTATIA